VVRALLARNGVPMTLGAADRAYRAGLADYYAGQYHDAVAGFDKVLAAEPDQALAAQYRADAVANYPNEVAGTSPWAWAGVAVGAFLLLATAAVAAFTLVRQRRKGRLAAGGPTAGRGPGWPAAFCPNCGAPHSADAHFCESCGHVLTRSASQQSRADHG
jgi:serine protease Do